MLNVNRPSLGEKFGYGLGAIGKDTVYMLISAFYLLYLYSSVKLPLTFITSVFLSIRIIDALDDIFIGWLFDRYKSRFGKFKPALLLGGVGSAIFTVMMFNVPELEGDMLYTYVIATYVLWTLFYSIHDVAFWGLIPTFGTESGIREDMTAIPRAGALIGGQAVILGGLPVLYFLRNNLHLEDKSFGLFALVISLIFLIATLITVLTIEDRTKNREYKKISLKLLGELVCHNDQVIIIAVLSFIQQLIISIVNSSIIFFLIYKPDGVNNLSDYILPAAISQLLGFCVYKNGCRVLSRRIVMISSCVFMAIGYTIMFFSNPYAQGHINTFTISYCIASFGMAWSIASTTVMSADCVDYGEFKHNIRTEGIIFAFQTAAAKLGLAAAIAISGFSFNLLSVLLSQLKNPSYLFSVRLAIIIVFILNILMIALYVSSYRLHGHFFQNILNNIENFKQGNIDNFKKSSSSALRYALDNEAVICNLDAKDVDEVLIKLTEKLYKISAIRSKTEFLNLIKRKIAENPAGIAEGIAIPHARGKGIRRMALAAATLKEPLDFGSPDGKKCDLVFMLATPDDHKSHLSLLGQLSIILNIPGFADKLRAAGSNREITDRILKCEKQLKN